MSFLDNFHHQISGNLAGPKLVFLHGLMGSGTNWRRIVRDFESEYHILTYDQRGHGRSFHPPQGYSPQDYASDLSLILKELGWSSILLVGHSMGGRNALQFAAQQNETSQQVRALVLEDIGPDASPQAVERIERLLQLVPTPFANRSDARVFFETQYAPLIQFYPRAQTVSRFLFTNIEAKPDGSYDWRFNKEAILASMREGRSQDQWASYASLKMPVLVVRGETSEDLPLPVYEQMLSIRPQSKGVEIQDAGHWVHFDQPEAFVSALQGFFKSVQGGNL